MKQIQTTDRIIQKEKDFKDYFNDYSFELSDPNTFFQRVNLNCSLLHRARKHVYDHDWQAAGAISSIRPKLLIEYFFAEQLVYSNKTHLAFFETPRHKIFLATGLDGFMDRIYIDDKVVEAARKELRKTDILGSAADSVMGVTYSFDSSQGLYHISKFINTIITNDLR